MSNPEGFLERYGIKGVISKKILKQKWGLIPTLVTSAAALGLCAAYIAYMMLRKTDLSYRPWSWSTEAPYQTVQPEQITKLYAGRTLELMTRPPPEIQELKKELCSYKS